MKKHLLGLFVLLFFAQLKSQVVFCPPGAEWKYLFRTFSGGYPFMSNMHYLRDSTLNNETVKILKYRNFFKASVGDRCPIVLIKQSGDTIFMRNCNTRNTWQILYNFAATAGQGWTTQVIDSMAPGVHPAFSHTVTVNAVTTVTLNNMALKKLLVSYCYVLQGVLQCETAEIIERMGCTTFLFNYTRKPSHSHADVLTDFLCYTDHAFGTKPFTAKGCNYDVSLTENNVSLKRLSLYPQPAGDRLNIVFEADAADKNYNLKITDVSGRVLLNSSLQGSKPAEELDLSALPKGIYFLQVLDGSSLIATKKFTKE